MTPAIDLKEFGVDSNVFNATEQPESDFVMTIAPRAAVWLPVGQRLIWQVDTSGDFVYFATHASERTINPSIGTRATLLSKRFTFFGEGSYENTRQRPNFEIDARSRRTEDGAAAGIGVTVTRRLEVELAGAVSQIRHDADAVFRGTSLSQMLNEDRTAASLTSRYRLSPLTTFVAEGGALVTVPVVIGVIVFAREVWRNARGRRETIRESWVRTGAVLGIVAIGFQEIVDFSLQIPGNALLFTVLCAIAIHHPREMPSVRRLGVERRAPVWRRKESGHDELCETASR